jgi:molybdopterin synthase catalytic subunit
VTTADRLASPGANTATETRRRPQVRRARIAEQPLSVDEVLGAVADPEAGGTALFVGTVRLHDGGREVSRLTYQAHPSAGRVIAEVAGRVAALPYVVAVAAEHRVGPLEVGDVAVVVAVSCAHRGDAFELSRTLIDRVKHEVPIWKLQEFTDGTSEWVACAGEPTHVDGARRTPGDVV